MRKVSEFADRDWQKRSEDGSIRIAVVGLGRFACRRALPSIQEAEFCETTVAVDLSLETAQSVADEFGIDHVLTANELLDGELSDEYDAMYVATPNVFHHRYVEAAAELGKHVLCEKPLDISADRASRLVRVCEKAGVTLMIGYRMQIQPIIRRMREMIEDGFIGDPVQISSRFSNQPPILGGPLQWRNDPEIAGGGALVDLGIYPLNTARFLLNEEPISVSGLTTTSQPKFTDVDEDVVFDMRFPDDVTASCMASLDAYPSSQLEVSGTEGEIRVTSAFGGLTPYRIVVERDDLRTEYTGQPMNEVIEEFDYFAYCLLSDTHPEPDGTDGVADLNLIESIYESAETGRHIAVDQ